MGLRLICRHVPSVPPGQDAPGEDPRTQKIDPHLEHQRRQSEPRLRRQQEDDPLGGGVEQGHDPARPPAAEVLITK